MPRYQYRCRSCGDELEVVQSIKDDPLTVCPSCSGALRKVFSPIGIAFKGSGFYRNDSRSASTKRDGVHEASEKAPSENKTADKTSSDTSSSEGSGTSRASPADSGAKSA
jgi:putative FmdB family regulatory protein